MSRRYPCPSPSCLLKNIMFSETPLFQAVGREVIILLYTAVLMKLYTSAGMGPCVGGQMVPSEWRIIIYMTL